MGTKVYDSALDLITFSRASGGTALRRVGYGPELVTNGTFDTDLTGWTSTAPATATWDAGQVDIARNSGSSVQALYQTRSFTIGSVYEVSIDVVAVSHSVGLFSTGGGVPIGASITSTGTHKRYFVGKSGDNGIYVGAGGSTTATATVDNISVKEVLFDRASDPLVLFNHPTNIPRIEYAADGTLKGLLVEEARTNLVTYSQDFSNAAWGNTNSTDSLNATGPDGTASATTLSDNNTGGTGSCDLTVAATVATSTTYTWSTFAKADSSSFLYLWGRLFTTPANGGVWFNLSNGTVGTQQTGWSGAIQDFGDGWYRCAVTFTTDAADTAGQLRIGIADADNDPAATLDGTSSILIYGAQFEAGAFPTSYIPTAGATATRAADIASIPVSAFGYNQKAGSVVIEAQTFSTAVNNHQDFSLHQGAVAGSSIHSGSRVGSGVAGQYTLWVQSGGSTVALISKTSAISDNTVYKAAWAAAADDFAVTVDGTAVTTDTAGAMPVAATEARIGYGAYGRLNGHIKSIAYYPRRLSNAQLQELTS